MSNAENGANIAPITPLSFIKKWKRATLTERQTAQEHFLDLCSLFGHPTPTQDDPIGDHFAFEKGATKIGGGRGFADVWKKDYFAWEYKRKNGNLDDALLQLIRYAPALESPPLQVVCDVEHFRIHTAWTNTVPAKYEIKLDDLADVEYREILRNVFYDPEKLKPTKTRSAVTKEAADKFSTIALRLQGRGSPEEIAHFVNQLVFCFFANSVKLLRDDLFAKLLKRASQKPEKAQTYFNQLFAAMESGGDFDLNDIAWFNGGLFDGRRALSLDDGDVGLLVAANSLDWSQIDPSIFGTLFERFLDPDKRAQIGAHYTDCDKIIKIIDPVIFKPLHKEWASAKAEIEGLLFGKITPPMRKKPQRRMKPKEAAEERRSRYLERLRNLKILDPACGSGNFLYLALQGVKDIENKANLECEMLGLEPRLPMVGPEILRGIEINPLAAELARTTIWIGDIQWRLRNGIHADPKPILRKLEAIECRDALISKISTFPMRLKRAPEDNYVEAEWPKAEFIVGNPPFLGIRLMRAGLGDKNVEQLFKIYGGCVSHEADLVTYWFEKARAAIKAGHTQRAGLVATNSIRGGANRRVLDGIAAESRIFEAWSDEPWVVEGAAVRVSIICFGEHNLDLRLNGKVVTTIHSNLTSGKLDITKARRLVENANLSFMGDTKGGAFDIPGDLARDWLRMPNNPNGRPNSDVLRPWPNGLDVTGRPRDMWIISFGWELSENEAALYEAPFEYLRTHVFPVRRKNRREAYRLRWWRHVEPRPGMWRALEGKNRFIVTPETPTHTVFSWLPTSVLPDKNLTIIAKSDYTTFGVLQSGYHIAWTRAIGSPYGNHPTAIRYNSTRIFQTFPFPQGLAPNVSEDDYENNLQAVAIAKAAERLDDLRNAWLNPPELVHIEPEVVPGYPDRILPKNTHAAVTLRERTLTNLYNQRPQWLVDAHRNLDAAVAAAYGWPTDISEADALAKLLELNLSRATNSELTPVVPKAKRKPRVVTPEEARRSPQFKLPIPGGKHARESLPTAKPLLSERAVTPRGRSRRRRRSA
jgi:type II restriction/modification system DNA methylase subunit YeeA